MSKLLEAANNVLWKLNHNESCGDYEGPARITRQDVTIRHLQEAVEQEANARLIAAAPELLAALELAERILQRDGIRPLRGEAWTDNELGQIQAAIAKAKGE